MRKQKSPCKIKKILHDAKLQLTELNRKLADFEIPANNVAKAIESIDQVIALVEADENEAVNPMEYRRLIGDTLFVLQQLCKLFLGN